MTQKSHSHQPLKVYLCDLTHDTVILVSDTIPINIGFIGAYANKIHGKNIELSFFDGTEMPGCVYLVPSARHSANPVFVKGQMPVRVRELDDIPSPYLNGMLDRKSV